MGLCAGFSAGVIAQAELLPGKEFPFAAVVPLSLDLKFGSGKDRYMSLSGWADTRVSAMVLAFKADFGVDLFWENEKLLLFPFAGIGMGVESTGGDHITYDGNKFVFTMQAGACFAIFLGKSVYATGSFKFCANLGAVNLQSTAAFEAGLGFKIG